MALFLVRRDRRVPVPVDVGDPQLSSEVGYLLTHDDPHIGWPGLQIRHAGDVGNPRTVSFKSVTVVRFAPPFLGTSGRTSATAP